MRGYMGIAIRFLCPLTAASLRARLRRRSGVEMPRGSKIYLPKTKTTPELTNTQSTL